MLLTVIEALPGTTSLPGTMVWTTGGVTFMSGAPYVVVTFSFGATGLPVVAVPVVAVITRALPELRRDEPDPAESPAGEPDPAGLRAGKPDPGSPGDP